MWISPPPDIPPLAWGPTPYGGGPSPRIPPYICQNDGFGGIIPYVTQKKFLGKIVLFGVFIGNIFFMSKVVRLTESELVKLVRKAINEQLKVGSGSMGDIMSLQDIILSYEIENNIAKVIENNPAGCNSQTYGGNVYQQGQKNQCRISGTTLCQGPCFQSQAMDGIYGPRTRAAYEKYKDIEFEFDGEKYTLQQFMDPNNFPTDYLSKSRTENWQIPALMDNIKAFQYWIWREIEKDSPKQDANCESDCDYKSMLCGNTFCKVKKAVDGSWGTNTKNAWKQYGDEYLKTYEVDTPFDEVYGIYNN